MARRMKRNQRNQQGGGAGVPGLVVEVFEVQRVCSGVGILDRSFIRKTSICVPPSSRIELSSAELSDLNGL
jgi:hypothetical protein